MPEGSDWSPRFAIFGDMGNENAKSLTRLQREVQLDYYSALIHVGDFAYDMNDVRYKYTVLVMYILGICD